MTEKVRLTQEKETLLITLVLQKTLVQRLVSHFPTGQIMFDAYNSLGLRAAKNHKSIKATGAVIGWGTDTPRELETWSPRLKFMEE